METFEKLTDPRNGKAKRHYLGEIIFIALAAMICGMEGFDDSERFAKLKKTWLRGFLKLPHGPPSDDTFRGKFLPRSIPRLSSNASPPTSAPSVPI